MQMLAFTISVMSLNIYVYRNVCFHCIIYVLRIVLIKVFEVSELAVCIKWQNSME